VRFYDTDTLEESAPVPLRRIRDGHFTTGQGFVTFLNQAPTAGCSTWPLAGACTNEARSEGNRQRSCRDAHSTHRDHVVHTIVITRSAAS
jgi:hypothetical protein